MRTLAAVIMIHSVSAQQALVSPTRLDIRDAENIVDSVDHLDSLQVSVVLIGPY